MEKELTLGKMNLNIKDSGKMAKDMELEFSHGKMEINIKDNELIKNKESVKLVI